MDELFNSIKFFLPSPSGSTPADHRLPVEQPGLHRHFHRWIISKCSDNGDEYALALVETESGLVMQITAIDSKLRFTDR